MKKALIIFIREPVAGTVKTRLAAQVGHDKALQVYVKLLQHTRDVAMEADCDRFVFTTGPKPGPLWNAFNQEPQTEGDLGARMAHAFAHLFNKNYDRVVIIGSDCPGLSAMHIQKSFDLLGANDLVIGPATDGGYYLLGMKKNHPEIFTGKTWSSSNLLHETKQTIMQLQLRYQLLEYLTDVDEFKDLPAMYMEAFFPKKPG